MRILMLTQLFDPEPTAKGLTFARELVRRGHQVEVVTGFPHYPGGDVYPGYHLRPWQRDIVEGIPVLRVWLYPSHDRSALRRFLTYTTFACSAAAVGTMLTQAPDVVYVYHPPGTIGLPALLMGAVRRVPFVYDINDLWPDTLKATGAVSNRLVMKAVGAWSRMTYRAAERVTVISPSFRSALIERGVREDKIDVIYNWCDEASIFPQQTDALMQQELGLDPERLTVMFAGTMGLAQALDAVLESARICAVADPRIQFAFLGSGVDRERLRQRAAAMRLENVRFLPVQPMRRMAKVLSVADILLVHLRSDPLFRMTVPSKTQAYLAAGRPIVMGVEGDAAELVRDAGAGVLCEPENAQSIADAILALSRMDPDERRRMGEAGRRYYCDNLSFQTGVNRFESVFEMALETNRSATRLHSSDGPGIVEAHQHPR